MIKKFYVLSASLILTGYPIDLEAHPGHGNDGSSSTPWHYLTEPFHIGIGICMVVLAIAGIKIYRGLRRGSGIRRFPRLVKDKQSG